MTGERATQALAGTRFAQLRWVEETGSTNADVLELARSGAAEGAVVIADHQRAGRGRAGRSWQAPPGSSILASILLRPAAAVAGLSTAAVALSAAEAVEDVTGLSPGLKWPNDVVVEGADGSVRKLAGVLAETDWPAGSDIATGWRAPSPTERVAVVVGIGLNVRWPAGVPGELRETAVDLGELTGTTVDREDLVVTLLGGLERWCEEMDGDGARLLTEWRRRLLTLGRRVRLDLGTDDVEGVAADVTAEGHLVLDTVEGDRRSFAVGDVTHLRTAAP